MLSNSVIVATDGTRTSRAAVDWAAREAQRQHRPLRVVHAYPWDWHNTRFDIGTGYVDVDRALAEAVIGQACARVRKIAPGLVVEADALAGPTVPRLIEAARDAALLVLGSRGRGGFTGLLLGSVSQRLAAHAPCPVVVVRGRDEDTAGPVVAGVDDTPAAEEVLREAFAAAQARGCGLTVIHSYPAMTPLWLINVSAADLEPPDLDADVRMALERRIAPHREKYPDVPVELVMTHEDAAAVLVEASRTARLAVVGNSRSLNSTGLRLLHHADCPVLVARQSVAAAV